MEKRGFSFKKLFWSYTFCAIPFALIAGILALFKVSAVYFNDSPVYGLKGFLLTIILIPFIGLILSVTNWLALSFGDMLHNLFLRFYRKQ